MRIGEESLPPRFGISDLPPDSGDVTLDTCDDAIPYFVMDRKGLGLHKQVGRWLVGVRRAWRRKRVAGKWLTRPHAPAREMQSPAEKTRVAARGWFLVPVLWDKLEISSRRSLRCRKKIVAGKSPEKFAGKVAGGECFLTTIRLTGKRAGTDDRNERERERDDRIEIWPERFGRNETRLIQLGWLVGQFAAIGVQKWLICEANQRHD
ncbi:hypothetical protein CK203_079813 [Vitis vinifera]|uniref:Uncharacterized protein n=1 Tax=Vitis vinifera TaxID=29760 RepID=A0A438DI26_VITVI|nr:hypothetical protein CK203_079813 [Vitis vinifera]